MAQHFAGLPPESFALAKRQLRDRTVTHAKHYANELDSEVQELWAAPETHAHIRDYLAKTVRKA